ncbi:MAG TPA: PD-(D/E)XK nuclease family protein [Jatrophihabitantaceae bacterium]|jgi:RecB family exonuclease|nr:PD-(D/E)XK nuclease family protein [Jatrophihabitantaceae bacterium]
MTLPGMPRRLFSCTPSRLASFDCPRRYRFTYLDKPMPQRGRPWAHNTVGATVHLALAKWWSLATSERTVAAGERLVTENWHDDGFRDAEQSARWRAVAGAWVARYLGDIDAGRDPVGVERTVSATTDALAISGRIDRVDDRGDELVVVDYKTGKRTSTADEARGSLALALYVLAVRRTLRRACRRVELHHVPSGTVAAFDHTDESLARHVARAEATAADIVTATDTLAAGAHTDEMFPPRPSPACSWCDFRAHCPEGLAASGEFEPWAGLDLNV